MISDDWYPISDDDVRFSMINKISSNKSYNHQQHETRKRENAFTTTTKNNENASFFKISSDFDIRWSISDDERDGQTEQQQQTTNIIDFLEVSYAIGPKGQ